MCIVTSGTTSISGIQKNVNVSMILSFVTISPQNSAYHLLNPWLWQYLGLTSMYVHFVLARHCQFLTNTPCQKSLKTISLTPSQPYPTYEACTPTNKIIFGSNTGVDEYSSIGFIPYADDPKFRLEEYVSEMDLAWNDLEDPNREWPHFITSMQHCIWLFKLN